MTFKQSMIIAGAIGRLKGVKSIMDIAFKHRGAESDIVSLNGIAKSIEELEDMIEKGHTEPVYSVAVKPGVYNVNNEAVIADNHTEAIRKYYERKKGIPKNSNSGTL